MPRAGETMVMPSSAKLSTDCRPRCQLSEFLERNAVYLIVFARSPLVSAKRRK